jgi:hypothetical protein
MASRRDLRYTQGMKTHALLIAALLAGSAQAATQTYVSLQGRDDSIPKLGRPGIAVQVEGMTQGEAILVMNELHRELARLVHTRPLDPNEEGDYDLKVMLDVTTEERAVSKIPFTAMLTSPRGDRLWRIEGRAETTDPAGEPAVYLSIGRNVVSALIHDGWLQPRFDPNDPPPEPPQIRKADLAQ